MLQDAANDVDSDALCDGDANDVDNDCVCDGFETCLLHGSNDGDVVGICDRGLVLGRQWNEDVGGWS